VQDDSPSGAAQDGAASEDQGPQRGWLTVASQTGSALKLGEQVEEQQTNGVTAREVSRKTTR
jgi:hypothetical protein